MYQRVEIIGYLGQDPEMRFTPQGVPVTNFSVATSKRWKDATSGEQREETTWFRVTAWRRLAETCNEYLAKGRLVFVEGTVKASAWSASDGDPRASLELTAFSVKFLGSKGEGQNELASSAGNPYGLSDESANLPSLNDTEEIPF